jgi:4-amino-4-deoxy-L-arabinose transferase-like glycosyltransferase
VWVLALTFMLQLHNLEHTALSTLDECCHAVVARNVFKHPLVPTLIDAPYLPYDARSWPRNHVWLHKPILPFWQIALSFALLGVSTLALRLPAAILSTAAAWLTYRIGVELFERRTALIAASLQAINPFVVTLVHGYQFSDNIDVALLFWVEVGVYFLVRAVRTGLWRHVLLAGAAQGLAFLCKSYLAAIVFGLALTAWLLPVCRLARRDDCRMSAGRLLALFGMTGLVAAPWMLYCASQFPVEFAHEHAQVLKHLYGNIENWAAPWDRLLFDYLIAIQGRFYTPVLVAALALFAAAIVQRHTGSWLSYAWALGVILPHVFAVSKTPSATLLALPPCLLLLGHFCSEALRGARWPLAALTGILVMSLILPVVSTDPGRGYPPSQEFGGVMMESLWVIWHVTGALSIAAVLAGAWRWLPMPRTSRISAWAARAFCACAMGWLGYQTALAAWYVTEIDANNAAAVELGEFARAHLPENAVLLCQSPRGSEHFMGMFYTDRTCYPLRLKELDETARQIETAGGVPYIVCVQRLSYPTVYVGRHSSFTVWRWQP